MTVGSDISALRPRWLSSIFVRPHTMLVSSPIASPSSGLSIGTSQPAKRDATAYADSRVNPKPTDHCTAPMSEAMPSTMLPFRTL